MEITLWGAFTIGILLGLAIGIVTGAVVEHFSSP